MNDPIRSIVIAGGGTAGWMAAAALGRLVGQDVAISLIEAPEIAPVGVGEATIPPFREFLATVGADEDEFIRQTQATFKLGIEFVDWAEPGNRYIHPFGRYGYDLDGIGFHHYWLRMQAAGDRRPIESYAFQAVAARAGKFSRPLPIERSPLASIAYAFHFDAALVARYLRSLAEGYGVRRIEGKIATVERHAQSGHLTSAVLGDGRRVTADFFIDCTGFRGRLIEGELAAGYDDWRAWLPCDRAVAVPCEPASAPQPYTRATAREAGWQWRIPLQHRIGNGHVYSSEYMSDDEATAQLLANLEGPALADPRLLRFTTGRRKRVWVGNCLALGLAAGFMEPLESTSIHLIQTGILRLMALFPNRAFDPVVIAEYNRQTAEEYKAIRDFLILHYAANRKHELPFWRARQQLGGPPELARKRAVFAACGQIVFDEGELFKATSWLAVLSGQEEAPRSYHPVADMISREDLQRRMTGMLQTIAASVDYLPSHGEYLADICNAGNAG